LKTLKRKAKANIKGKSGYRNRPFGCGSAALRYANGFHLVPAAPHPLE
jgi:hypothetical protein